ncbi:unnamed protein product, partial [Phaeothamnion confervicola]
QVRAAVPDLAWYPLFAVRCSDAKEALAKRVDALHTLVVEAVAGDNRRHMAAMAQRYQDIAQRLVREPADAAELRALQEF